MTRFGNRLEKTEGVRKTKYNSNHLNQYISIGAVTPEYDSDGNLLLDTRATYSWNANNRLSGVELTDGTEVTNTYDYMGRRVRKVVTKPDGAETNTTFIYDGWNVIAEIVPTPRGHRSVDVEESRAAMCFYTWGRDLSGTLQGAGGVGGLLAITKAETGETHYPSYDGNGNVIQLTNSDGGILATYEYDPFGTIIHQSGPEADNNPWHFSTKYFDHETGLLYYGFRYYAPNLGRWISRDPFQEIGGLNLYRFVQNSPVVFSDYLGSIAIVDDLTVGLLAAVVVVAYYVISDAVDDGVSNGSPITNAGEAITELFRDVTSGLEEVAEHVIDLTKANEDPNDQPQPGPVPVPPLTDGKQPRRKKSCCKYRWLKGPTTTQLQIADGYNGYDYQTKVCGLSTVEVCTPSGKCRTFDGGKPWQPPGSTRKPISICEAKYGYSWMSTVERSKWKGRLLGAFNQNDKELREQMEIVKECDITKYYIYISNQKGLDGMKTHHSFASEYMKLNSVVMP